MRQIFNILNRKVLPLFLAAVMLFDFTSYSFAQMLPKQNQDQKVSYILQNKYENSQDIFFSDFSKILKDNVKAAQRAKEIKDIFTSAAKNTGAENSLPSPLTKQAFNTKYSTALQAQYNENLKHIEAERQKIIEQISQTPDADAQANKAALDNWFTQNKGALDAWRNKSMQQLPAQYNTYVSAFDKDLKQQQKAHEEQLEKYVQSMAHELMEIYKAHPTEEVKNIVLEVSPVILMLKKGEKSFFTPQETATIKALYLKELKNNKSCDVVVKKKTTTWTQVNSPTVGPVSMPYTHKEYGMQSQEGCNRLLNGIVGLGIIGQGNDDAYAIVDFMEKNSKTAIAVPSMLMGASALLAMKEYGPLRGFVASSVKEEDNNQIYFPSLTDIVDMVAFNRNYLGEVSRYTQYPVEGGAMGNGWEDLAYILADDNTPQSREILNSFAFKCTVFPGDALVDDRLSCMGIRPFLLGAVLSKANLAEQYTPDNSWSESPQQMMGDGSVYTLTPKQIADIRKRNQIAKANYEYFASSKNISKSAMLGHWFYKSEMGDVNAETKLLLDTKIYNKFGKDLARGKNTAIQQYTKGGAIYNAKKSKRETVAIVRQVAMLGDIALLIWGIWDLGRLSVQGVRMFVTLRRNIQMVRAGATIAERAVMIRRLGAAKQFIALRKFGNAATASARFATGVRMPMVSVDSFVTGMPKPVVQLADLAKFKPAPAPALRELTATTVVGQALLPGKKLYQEAYASIKGTDPFKINKFESKTLPNAKLVSPSGNPVSFDKLEMTSSGLLEVDGVLQNSYKLQMPVHDLDFFLSRVRTQGVYDYLHFDGTLNSVPTYSKILQKATSYLPQALRPKNLSNAPISLELYDATGAPMNAFVRIDNTFGTYADLAKTRDLTLRGGNLFSGEKVLDVNLTLSGMEFKKLGGLNFERLPNLSFIYTKSKPVKTVLNAAGDMSAFNQARVYAKDGKVMEYSTLGINKDGFLTIDGEIQKVFKTNLGEKEFTSFITAARSQGFEGNLEFKVAVPGAQRTPTDIVKNIFTPKKNQFAISMDVYDNLGNPLNATLKMDPNFNLHKAFEGVSNIYFRGGKFTVDGTTPLDFTISVPKNQIITMAKSGVDFTKMPPMDLQFTKSKMGPLYLNMALSFSAASAGLYYPLTNQPYKDKVSNFEISLITIGLPYGFSLLSPFASGVVSKYGAAKTQMAALSIAAAGLGVSAIAGYRGQATLLKDANGKVMYDKETGKPLLRSTNEALPLWPLYVASGVTGAASALGRASLSVLNKQLEVGNSMLKGMAMKNIGGLAMLLPPALISGFGGEVDFSSAFPVLAGVSMFTVGWMKYSKYADDINKIPGYRYSLKEGWNAYKVIKSPSVWPYVGAFTMYAGYEGQVLFKTAAALSKESVGGVKFSDKPSAQKNYVALASGAAIAVAPAFTRWFAPKKVVNYSPHIVKALGASATGGLLMLAENNGENSSHILGWTGAALVGYGTANMYMFLQKSMLAALQKTYKANPEKFATMVNGVKVLKPYEQVETEALTAYTAANLGLAAGQQLSSWHGDYRKEKLGENDWDANRFSMWIPATMMVGGTALLSKRGIIKLPKFTLPSFSNPITKIPAGMVGVPYAVYLSNKIGNGDFKFDDAKASLAPFSAPQFKMPALDFKPIVPKAGISIPLTPKQTPAPQQETLTQQGL